MVSFVNGLFGLKDEEIEVQQEANFEHERHQESEKPSENNVLLVTTAALALVLLVVFRLK